MNIDIDKLEFIKTNDGRIGIGIPSPCGEEGGFKVLKWCTFTTEELVRLKRLIKEAYKEGFYKGMYLEKTKDLSWWCTQWEDSNIKKELDD